MQHLLNSLIFLLFVLSVRRVCDRNVVGYGALLSTPSFSGVSTAEVAGSDPARRLSLPGWRLVRAARSSSS